MLSTAVVYLLDKTGKHECRTLLDQSSQVNVIKTSLANRLHFSNLSCRTLILDVRAAHYAHTQLPTLRIRDSCSTAYHFSRFSILYPARRESHKWPIMGYHVHYRLGKVLLILIKSQLERIVGGRITTSQLTDNSQVCNVVISEQLN